MPDRGLKPPSPPTTKTTNSRCARRGSPGSATNYESGTGSAEATQKILYAAEEIDQIANKLSAALKGKLEQDLAQDVTDLVIRIFEACNFQDLIGQRITKVTATLNAIENQSDHTTASPPSAPEDAAEFLHGPRLAKDPGHMDQSEIDALFGD